MKGRKIHGESNVWSTSQKITKDIYRFDVGFQ